MARLARSRKVKGHWFDAQSGHMPGLRVGSLAWARMEGSPIDVSLSHQCFFPCLSPFLPPSLKINKIFKKQMLHVLKILVAPQLKIAALLERKLH